MCRWYPSPNFSVGKAHRFTPSQRRTFSVSGLGQRVGWRISRTNQSATAGGAGQFDDDSYDPSLARGVLYSARLTRGRSSLAVLLRSQAEVRVGYFLSLMSKSPPFIENSTMAEWKWARMKLVTMSIPVCLPLEVRSFSVAEMTQLLEIKMTTVRREEGQVE